MKNEQLPTNFHLKNHFFFLSIFFQKTKKQEPFRSCFFVFIGFMRDLSGDT